MRDIRRLWLGAGLALTLGLFGMACQPAEAERGVHWTRDPDWGPAAAAVEPSEPGSAERAQAATASPAAADDGQAAVASTEPGAPHEQAAEPSEAASSVPLPRPGLAARADGRIEALSGRELTLATRSAARRVVLAEAAQLEEEGPGTRWDPRPGQLTAVVARPDGVATSLRLYPPGYPLAMVRAPLVGARQGEILTTGLLTAAHPSAVVVSSLGQHFTFVLPPEALVWKPVPLAADSLAPGQRLVVSGERGSDGVLVARRAFLPSEPPPLIE